jgi:hypothetical protein
MSDVYTMYETEDVPFPFILSSRVGCLVAHVFPAIGREMIELLLLNGMAGRGCAITIVVGIMYNIIECVRKVAVHLGYGT